jgi:predicted O-methyltransferase YrrM
VNHESFILALHSHLLGRAPSEVELRNWTRSAARLPPGKLLEEFVQSSEYKWRRGVDTVWPPGFYHSPVVNPETARAYVLERALTSPEELLEIGIDADAMQRFWDANAETFRLEPFSNEKAAGKRFYLKGGLISYGDALTLLAMLGHFRPKQIVEIGSGFSTACMLDCADLHGLSELKITCIEPYPTRLKQLLHSGDYDRVSLIEAPLQTVAVEDIITPLKAGDFLFIDSTHVLKTGSDVHYELFHILPRLRPGVVIHFHDCPYPFEYPDRWIFEENYSWNEAYALRAFLMYNDCFKILFWGSLVQRMLSEKIRAESGRFGTSEHLSFWITKVK